MERELRDLVNLITALEQTAGGFVPQVVETQILDPERVARACEGRSYALGVIREDVLARLRLCLDDRPRLRRVFETPVIAVPVGRVLGVANNASACCRIVVVPFQPTDLSLASSGADWNSMTGSMQIVDRLSRRAKYSRRRESSSGVGRRARLRALPIRRSSRHALRACCTTSGRTGSSLTLRAALSTTAIQIRSFATVAAPVPSARRERT